MDEREVTGGAPPKRRRRWLRWTGAAVVAVVLLVVGGLWNRILDATVVAPWAWPPGPVLTTGWVGTATTPAGNQAALWIELRRPPAASPSDGFQVDQGGKAVLVGEGRFCSSAGAPLDLEVNGSASRQPDDLTVGARSTTAVADGLVPNAFTGAWDGADELVLTGALTVMSGGTSVAGSEIADSWTPTTFTLRPGTAAELAALCPAR